MRVGMMPRASQVYICSISRNFACRKFGGCIRMPGRWMIPAMWDRSTARRVGPGSGENSRGIVVRLRAAGMLIALVIGAASVIPARPSALPEPPDPDRGAVRARRIRRYHGPSAGAKTRRTHQWPGGDREPSGCRRHHRRQLRDLVRTGRPHHDIIIGIPDIGSVGQWGPLLAEGTGRVAGWNGLCVSMSYRSIGCGRHEQPPRRCSCRERTLCVTNLSPVLARSPPEAMYSGTTD